MVHGKKHNASLTTTTDGIVNWLPSDHPATEPDQWHRGQPVGSIMCKENFQRRERTVLRGFALNRMETHGERLQGSETEEAGIVAGKSSSYKPIRILDNMETVWSG